MLNDETEKTRALKKNQVNLDKPLKLWFISKTRIIF
jgi:hypothetical protein